MKQYLLWIWLACGLGLLLMGLSSSWNDALFQLPQDAQLQSYTGTLQSVKYDAPTKSPTLIEITVYQKQGGLQYGYLRYGLHEWEAQLKPYVHQEITMLLGEHQQVWAVNTDHRAILKSVQIEQRLQRMKKAQQAVATNIVYVGLAMVLLWLFFFRHRKVKTQHV